MKCSNSSLPIEGDCRASGSFMLCIHHGGRIVELGDSFCYEGGSEECKGGWDADLFGYINLHYQILNLGYQSYGKVGYNVPEVSTKLQIVTDDKGVVEFLNLVNQGHKKIDIYVDQCRVGDVVDALGLLSRQLKGRIASSSCPTVYQDSSDPLVGSKGLYDQIIGTESDKPLVVDEGEENEDSEYDESDTNDELDDDELASDEGEESEDSEYRPIDESDTDDELDDDELASDDGGYAEARQNKDKLVHDDDLVTSEPSNFQNSEFGSEYENSDAEVNFNTSSEEGEACGEEEWSRRRKSEIVYDPKCDHRSLEFSVGMRFEDVKQCMAAIQKYGIYQGFGLKITRSNETQCEVVCEGENCKWRIYGSMIRLQNIFVIKSYFGQHTCHRDMKNESITPSWIDREYLEWFRTNPNPLVKELAIEIMHQHSVEVPIKAKRKALKMLRGSVGQHHALLRSYQAELTRADSSGRFELLEEDGYVKGFFVGFSSLTRGFLKGCRPIIGFDGCLLKTFLGGALLSAVGKDGNNQMYPICWAVVWAENEYFWNWFLELVFAMLGIGNGLGWTLISDQQNGLLNAIHRQAPQAEVRKCARRVYCDWKKDHKGPVLKNIFWRAVRSTHEADYRAACNNLKEASKKAYDDFIAREPRKWCKSFVSSFPKCDMVDNNVCGTFNRYVAKSRSKHIIDMLEDVRSSLTVRHRNKLTEMSGVTDQICPTIRKKLETNERISRTCEVRPAAECKFEVSNGEDDQVIVDLNTRTCSCKSWDISGIPCAHACKGIDYIKEDPVDYVHDYYSVRKYVDAYSASIVPMKRRKMWARVEEMMPHQPKRKRKRCGRCGKLGHNKRTCREQVNDSLRTSEKIPRKRGRPRKIVNREGEGDIGGSTTQPMSATPAVRERRVSGDQSRERAQGHGLRIFGDSGSFYITTRGGNRVKCGPNAISGRCSVGGGDRVVM